jgi:hypothetical protein
VHYGHEESRLKKLVGISILSFTLLLSSTSTGCKEQTKQVITVYASCRSEELEQSVELNGLTLEVPSNWVIVKPSSPGNSKSIRATATLTESQDRPWVEISSSIQNLNLISNSLVKSDQIEKTQSILTFRNFANGTIGSKLIMVSIPSKNVIISAYPDNNQIINSIIASFCINQ